LHLKLAAVSADLTDSGRLFHAVGPATYLLLLLLLQRKRHVFTKLGVLPATCGHRRQEADHC